MPWNHKLLEFLQKHISDKRPPDVIIGGKDNPYLHRWWVIPRNPFFNIYLHHFLRSDDDRALHDHMYVNMSWLLDGEYNEIVPIKGMNPAFGWTKVFYRKPGAFYFRRPTQLHRVELKRGIYTGQEMPVWTLFCTLCRVRNWGFQCKNRWVPWQEFTGTDENGSSVVGNGCGEE